jgi:hypothetical protein
MLNKPAHATFYTFKLPGTWLIGAVCLGVSCLVAVGRLQPSFQPVLEGRQKAVLRKISDHCR